eukprot:scaffold34799_cov42-Cyclotella_meneghiniana.AAC.1
MTQLRDQRLSDNLFNLFTTYKHSGWLLTLSKAKPRLQTWFRVNFSMLEMKLFRVMTTGNVQPQ